MDVSRHRAGARAAGHVHAGLVAGGGAGEGSGFVDVIAIHSAACIEAGARHGGRGAGHVDPSSTRILIISTLISHRISGACIEAGARHGGRGLEHSDPSSITTITTTTTSAACIEAGARHGGRGAPHVDPSSLWESVDVGEARDFGPPPTLLAEKPAPHPPPPIRTY